MIRSPENWGRFPFCRIFLSNGLVQPPTFVMILGIFQLPPMAAWVFVFLPGQEKDFADGRLPFLYKCYGQRVGVSKWSKSCGRSTPGPEPWDFSEKAIIPWKCTIGSTDWWSVEGCQCLWTLEMVLFNGFCRILLFEACAWTLGWIELMWDQDYFL